MHTRFSLVTVIATALAVAAPVRAQQVVQQSSTPKVFSFTPYVGYMVWGDYLKGPIGTTLTNKNGAIYGAQVGIDLSPNVALLGNVAYSKSDLQVGAPFIGGVGVGSSNIWLYDADLQLSLPSSANHPLPFKPFVQVGAGAMHYNVEALSVLNTKVTNLAFNVGLGFDYQLSPGIGVRLMAKDYIGKFDFKQATSLDVSGKTTNNVAVTAGIKIGF
jgi:Outer membrane protein beta-barrel domain